MSKLRSTGELAPGDHANSAPVGLFADYYSDMTDLGKVLIVVGVALVAGGILLILAGKMNLPLGRLPGDIVYRGKHTTVYFPIVTSILASVVLSVVLYLISRWRR